MSDFKWEMQQRVDAGMSPDEAYNATRDSYAAAYDNRDKTERKLPPLPERVVRGWDGLPRIDDKHGPLYIPPRLRAEFRCNPDESGGVRDGDDASAGGA